MTDDDAVKLRRAQSAPPRRLARGRLGRIVAAYVVACVVAAVVLPIGFLVRDLIAGRALTIQAGDWLVLPAGLFIVSVIAAAPFATLAIVIAEGFRLASPVPYLVAGGLIGLGVEAVMHGLHVSTPDVQPVDATIFGLVASVGALCALVYWLIAVRHRQTPASR